MTSFDLPGQRKVGNLTLHRQQRKISIQEYRALSADERLDMIRLSHGKQKYDLILNAPDAERLVPQLHPQEIYLTVNEIGPADITELLMLSSTEQLTTLLDMDCWDGDRLHPKVGLYWLQVLLDAGEETVCRVAREADPELLTLILKKLIRVTRGPEAYDDDDAENANRLEGLYDIDYADEDTQKCVGALLSILLNHDQKSYLLLMEMVRSEIEATLEEEVYRSRSNRLLDLGLTTPMDARSIYAAVDPDTFVPTAEKRFDLEAEGVQHPGGLLSRGEPAALLAEILAQGISHEQAAEMGMLANRKMSADLVDLSDGTAVSGALSHLYRTLNLGLEHLVHRDAVDARQVFNDCYLLQLFQLGHSLTARIQNRARDLLKSPIAPFLDEPYRHVIEGLSSDPPRLYCGTCLSINRDEKDFETLRDVHAADAHLRQIAVQRRLFEEAFPFTLPNRETFELSGCQPDQGSELSLSDLFLTALANRLLGRDFVPDPIPEDELSALHGIACDGNRLSESVRGDICTEMESILPGAGDFADFCLQIWQEEFCGIGADAIDPRFIRGLIIRLSPGNTAG